MGMSNTNNVEVIMYRLNTLGLDTSAMFLHA